MISDAFIGDNSFQIEGTKLKYIDFSENCLTSLEGLMSQYSVAVNRRNENRRETMEKIHTIAEYWNELYNENGFAIMLNDQKLSINESFVKIGNSGQVWQFSDINKLKKIIASYGKTEFKKTNLIPIIDYYNGMNTIDVPIISFNEWFNCNTISDYQQMKKYIER